MSADTYRVNIDVPYSSIRFVSKEFNTEREARKYFNEMINAKEYIDCLIILHADNQLLERKVIGGNEEVEHLYQR